MHSLPPPRPDFANLRRVLLREGEPDRLPFVELLGDHVMKEAFLGERALQPVPGTTAYTWENRARYVDFDIRFWYQAGDDYITLLADVPLVLKRLAADDTAALKREQRQWQDENAGPIMSWEDFEHYPWPKPEDIDYFNLEWQARTCPRACRSSTAILGASSNCWSG